MKRFFWLFVLLCVGCAPAPKPVGGQEANGRIALRNLAHLSDSTGRLSVDEVMSQPKVARFQELHSQTNRLDFGYNKTAVHWLAFDLADPAPNTTGRLMLELEYANLDDLELFQRMPETKGGEVIRSLGRTGDRYAFGQRPYRNNNYVFPIQLQAGQKGRFLLRLNQPHAILSFAMQTWQRPAFVALDRVEYVGWGMFIGIICMMMILNLVMLVALRDWIYAWYCLYLHFITMHLFTDAGLSFQYLWPTNPQLNNFLPVYLYVWAAMVAQLTFMQYFIQQTGQNSRLFGWVNAFKQVVTVAVGLALVVPLVQPPGWETWYYRIVSLLTSLLVPFLVGLSIASLYERSRQIDRDPMVRYYGYALWVQFAGYLGVAFLNLCQSMGWPLPFDVETYVLLMLTVLTDLIFFAYGLTYRYNQARQRNSQLALNLIEQRQQAQQQVIHSLEEEQQRLAQDLHDDVGPLLATAKGYLSRLARNAEGPTLQDVPTLQQAQTLLDEAADELRTLSHQLLPRQLEEVGLASALAEATRKLQRPTFTLTFLSLGEARSLSAQQGQLLFSLAVQLIRHARDVAQATDLTVQLLHHEEQTTLSVEDNGQPIDVDGLNRSLRTKADLLKAELLIDATEAGNSVMVSVPLNQPALP